MDILQINKICAWDNYKDKYAITIVNELRNWFNISLSFRKFPKNISFDNGLEFKN